MSVGNCSGLPLQVRVFPFQREDPNSIPGSEHSLLCWFLIIQASVEFSDRGITFCGHNVSSFM